MKFVYNGANTLTNTSQDVYLSENGELREGLLHISTLAVSLIYSVYYTVVGYYVGFNYVSVVDFDGLVKMPL